MPVLSMRPSSALAALVLLTQLAWCPPAQFTEPARVLLRVRGAQAGDLFGWHVRLAGDTNGDGVIDFAVASPFHDLNQGRVSMHSGRDGSQLWSQEATTVSAILGYELQTMNDIDQDGVREVVASAPFLGNGVVYVWSGRTGALLRTLQGFGSDLGYAIATDGDFDGDGTLDLALGATADGAVHQGGGRVYVLSMSSFSTVATIDPLPGQFSLGTALAFLGDVDADGRDDLAVGSRLSASGSSGMLHVVTMPAQTPVFRTSIAGVEHGSAIDTNHARPGRDLDGDGVRDLWYGEPSAARVRVFSGADGAVLRTYTDLGGDNLGAGGGIVDDVNDDGFPDVLAGATANAVNAPRNGRVLLFSGRDGRRLRTLTHTGQSALLGSGAYLFADLDGDGIRDLLLAARGLGPGFPTPPTLGEVYVVAGEDCLAGWRSYGSGLAGTNGVPDLTMSADPVLGTSPALVFGSAAPAATAALLAVGSTATSLPTPWGGTLLVVPSAALPLALPPTGVRLTFGVPTAPVLCGAELFAQGFHADAGASLGIAESLGMRLRLGR